MQSLSIAGKEGGAAPTINIAQTMNMNTAQTMNMNNSTDGGGTPEWAKRQGGEQQFQGRLLRELHEALTTNKKAPPSASRYTSHDPDNVATAFESPKEEAAAPTGTETETWGTFKVRASGFQFSAPTVLETETLGTSKVVGANGFQFPTPTVTETKTLGTSKGGASGFQFPAPTVTETKTLGASKGSGSGFQFPAPTVTETKTLGTSKVVGASGFQFPAPTVTETKTLGTSNVVGASGFQFPAPTVTETKTLGTSKGGDSGFQFPAPTVTETKTLGTSKVVGASGFQFPAASGFQFPVPDAAPPPPPPLLLLEGSKDRTIHLMPCGTQLLFTNYGNDGEFMLPVGTTTRVKDATVVLVAEGHLEYNFNTRESVSAHVPFGATETKFWCVSCAYKRCSKHTIHN